RLAQSGWKPEALMMGAQRAESAFWIWANSAAEVPVGWRPKASSRVRNSGDRTAATTVAFRRAITSGGVLAGAYIPNQPLPWIAKPDSVKVGTSAKAGDRSGPDVARTRIRPALCDSTSSLVEVK